MRISGKGRLLCLLAFLLLVATATCFYKAIGLGITAEEGLKYSVPAMRASKSCSSAYASETESGFRVMRRTSDKWGTGAEILFLLCLGTAFVGLRLVRKDVRPR